MTTTKSRNQIGRPTNYTPKLGENICAEIAGGATLRSLEQKPEMPSKRSMLRWRALHPEFRTLYGVAHEIRADDTFAKSPFAKSLLKLMGVYAAQ